MKTPIKTLKGSCQCQKVKFSVRSDQYYPYQLCYCSICRKQEGGGGFSINISAQAPSLKVVGKKFVKIHHARMKDKGDQHAHRSSGERHFCGECGSCLWVFDKKYPDLLHPFASAIDTPLPVPPERTHICLDSKASWVTPDFGPRDKKFKQYPKESIEQWHTRVIG